MGPLKEERNVERNNDVSIKYDDEKPQIHFDEDMNDDEGKLRYHGEFLKWSIDPFKYPLKYGDPKFKDK